MSGFPMTDSCWCSSDPDRPAPHALSVDCGPFVEGYERACDQLEGKIMTLLGEAMEICLSPEAKERIRARIMSM